MKRLLFALGGLFFLTACNDASVKGDTKEENHASVAESNAEKTKAVYRAIESGNTNGLDTLFTSDVVDHNGNFDGSDIVGLDSVKAMLARIHTYFDGLKMEMLHHATSNNGEYHYATVRMTGKSKANPWGMPVGMDIDDTSVDVMKLKDGKCSDHWGFMSMADMQEMMKSMSGGAPPTAADTSKTR